MIPTRQHDETLVEALAMLCAGQTINRIAAELGVDKSNLGNRLKSVRDADVAYCGEGVLRHYPIRKQGGRNK